MRGEGIFLIDETGQRFIDACGGAAVSCLGHGHPSVIAAMADQAARLEYAHTGFFTTEAAEKLAAVIAGMSPGSLDRVWFTSSGSEATEAAVKLARQYHLERGEPGRSRLIARRFSYHGNTLGALAVGGSAWRRAPYDPFLINVALIDPCFEYRFAEPGEDPEEYGRRAADGLEKEIQRAGARSGHGVHCGDGSRGDGGGGPSGSGVLSACARDLRRVRRAPDPRRGDVRFSPDRHLPLVRAGRCGPGHRDFG